jgi:O-antigen/teichoic acid export membrane protein
VNATLRTRRSLGVMIGASLVSAFCGVILTFGVPRLLSVDEFGLWRTFLLYTGYAGLLHFGLVDGALLRWLGRDGEAGRENTQRAILELPSLMIPLLAEHLVLIGLALVAFLLPFSHTTAWILVALAGYALLYNLTGLTQVFLQAHHRFSAVAVGIGAPSAFFALSLCIFVLSHASLKLLLAAYLLCWMLTLGVLWVAAYRGSTGRSALSEVPSTKGFQLVSDCVRAGLPVMLANTGLGLMQSADRITVNITRPLHDFAIYSLSQSTIYVPLAILTAVSRVALSWFARGAAGGLSGRYARSTRLLSLFWMLLLPYYFVVEYLVSRFLPRYAPGLPAGRILLFSVLFLSLIQIVQMSTFNLQGRQRQFFLGSLGAVALAFLTAWFGSRQIGTLASVAWSQVLTAGVWWLGNEAFLRRQNLTPLRDIFTVILTFGLSACALTVSSFGGTVLSETLFYYVLITIPTLVLYWPELREAMRLPMRLENPS